MGRKMRFDVRKNGEKKKQLASLKKRGRPRKHPPIVTQTLDWNDIDLPSNWVRCESDREVTFSKIVPSSSKGSVVTHTITIKSNGTWIVHVLGKKLDISQHSALKAYAPSISNGNISKLVGDVNRLFLCPGHPDSHFVDMIKRKKSTTKGRIAAVLDSYCDVTIEGQTYSTTVRHVNCDILVSSPAKCHACTSYRSTLRALYSRFTKQKSKQPTSPRSHVNIRYLSSPEKQLRYKRVKSIAKAASRKVTSLENKIRQETALNGVQLDEELNKDITTIMDECSGYIDQTYAEKSFERLFWEEQKKARQLNNMKQMRWHPMLIRWCLRLKLMSSAAYDAFRSSGVLKLPSERTLRDYSNWMKAKSGFQLDVDRQLMEEAKLATIPDFQKYVCIVFDEVKIKEGLVYDKEGFNLIGFVDLDNINNHLQAFDSGSKRKLATHIVAFMVRGLFSGLRFPYAQFPCSTLNAHTLYALVWECVAHLETLGFKVLALTADGASCNRKFFKMHKTSASFPFKTPNIYADEERPIFFFSDPPHLMKTTRNCWANSFGHSYTRELWIKGHNISWQTVVNLYKRHCLHGSGLSILPKLTAEHVHLNSYSKMKVKLAVQVLSNSVAVAIDLENKPYLDETRNFVQKFNRLFDCMNVRCLKEGVYKRKPDVRPYNSSSDYRIKWLKTEFLTWLDEWDESVKSETELTPSQQDRRCLSRETLEGLRFTVNAFCEMVPYIFTNIHGAKYFLSEKLCQDPLESFFGNQRTRGGSCDNPNVARLLHSGNSLN